MVQGLQAPSFAMAAAAYEILLLPGQEGDSILVQGLQAPSFAMAAAAYEILLLPGQEGDSILVQGLQAPSFAMAAAAYEILLLPGQEGDSIRKKSSQNTAAPSLSCLGPDAPVVGLHAAPRHLPCHFTPSSTQPHLYCVRPGCQ
ncbi:hypothetical protein MY3296_002916 [Beauveria thailandica]